MNDYILNNAHFFKRARNRRNELLNKQINNNMAKNKDKNISPSKGISIFIKNDVVQPLPPKPKKKRRCKRINLLPNTPAPIMQQSAGDTSYIKTQPGRFSLWRDTTTSTPVLTLAQATSQGFIP
jgi:hypothetical protein